MTALGDFSAGDILLASDLNAIGTWTSYTPTISVALTLGNASVDFRYSKINDVVIVHGTIILGSTSSMGSGAILVSLPFTQAQVVNQCLGYGQINDTGTATYPAWPLSYSSGNVAIFTPTVTGVYIRESGFTASIPFTWATNDSIQITMIYRAA